MNDHVNDKKKKKIKSVAGPNIALHAVPALPGFCPYLVSVLSAHSTSIFTQNVSNPQRWNVY